MIGKVYGMGIPVLDIRTGNVYASISAAAEAHSVTDHTMRHWLTVAHKPFVRLPRPSKK